MTDVSQCPFCELRFQARWELKAHLESDHPGRIEEKQRAGDAVVEDGDPDDPRPL
jgi:hypothetical protein